MNIKLILSLILMVLATNFSLYAAQDIVASEKFDRYTVLIKVENYTDVYPVVVEVNRWMGMDPIQIIGPRMYRDFVREKLFIFNISNSLTSFGIPWIYIKTNQGPQKILSGEDIKIKFFDNEKDKCEVDLLKTNYGWNGMKVIVSDKKCSLNLQTLKFTIKIAHDDSFKCPIPSYKI